MLAGTYLIMIIMNIHTRYLLVVHKARRLGMQTKYLSMFYDILFHVNYRLAAYFRK